MRLMKIEMSAKPRQKSMALAWRGIDRLRTDRSISQAARAG
jgi:hypothetical protein